MKLFVKNYIIWVLPAILVLVTLVPVASWAQPRIVSLKPNITEILFELGLGQNIVGVTSYCDYPAQVRQKEKVADYVRVEMERLLWLKPSHVMASKENSQQKEIKFMRNLGLDVFVFNFERFSDIEQAMAEMGLLFHKEGMADQLVAGMRARLQHLRSRVTPEMRSKRVLIVVGSHPLVVVGGNNFIADGVKLLGLTSIAVQSKLRYPTFSTEQLINAAPDVVFDLTVGMQGANRAERLRWYRNFTSLPAVAVGAIYFPDPKHFRPSPLLMNGLEALVEAMASQALEKSTQ